MNKFITTSRSLLPAALVCVVAAGGAYAFVYHLVASAHGEYDTIQSEFDALVREQNHHAEVRALADTLREPSDELSGYLLSSDDPIEFLALLEAIGLDAGAGLKVQSIEKEDQTSVKLGKGEKPPEPHVKVVLSVSGSWSEVYHVITLLETMPYALSIEDITVQEQQVDEMYRWEGQIHLWVKIAD